MPSHTKRIVIAAGVGGILLIAGGWAIASTKRRHKLEDLAVEVARHHWVPVPVFLAMVAAESSWNPRARNCSGSDGALGCAWGLLQMIPATAADAGLVGDPSQLLDDPGLALDLGAKHMAKIQRQWGGPHRDAMRYRVAWAWGNDDAMEWPPTREGIQTWILTQGKFRKALRTYGWDGSAWPDPSV